MRYSLRLTTAIYFAIAGNLSAQEFDPDAEWSVENLGPTINSGYSDRFSVISNDGLSLYFASNRPANGSDQPQPWDIYVAWRDSIEEPFGDAINIGPAVNSAFSDHSASLSPDELTMYFASDRPGGCGGMDLYVSYRDDASDHLGWSDPVHLGCNINSESDESCPILTAGEDPNLALIYFVRNTVPGEINFDFFITQATLDPLEFEEPLPLLELNTPVHDGHFDPRHGLIWSEREGGLGGGDLWSTSWMTESFGWMTPENLGPSINTEFDESLPSVSANGRLYFPSNRPGGYGAEDIYVAIRPAR